MPAKGDSHVFMSGYYFIILLLFDLLCFPVLYVLVCLSLFMLQCVCVCAGHGISPVSCCRCLTGVPSADHLINSTSNCCIKPRLIHPDSTRSFSLPHGTNIKASSSVLLFMSVCTLLIWSPVLQVKTPVSHGYLPRPASFSSPVSSLDPRLVTCKLHSPTCLYFLETLTCSASPASPAPCAHQTSKSSYKLLLLLMSCILGRRLSNT